MIVYARYPEKAVKDSYTPAIIKIQTLIMAGVFTLLPFCFFSQRLFVYLILILMTAVLFSSFPFSMTAFKKDKIIGLLSPFYCLLRAGVFAAGSVGGIMSVVINKINNH